MGPTLSDAMKELSMCVRSQHSSLATPKPFCSAIDRTYEEIAKKNERGLSMRIWSSSVDKDKIKDSTTRLDRSLKYFAVCMLWVSYSFTWLKNQSQLRLDMAMAESLYKVEQELLNTRSEYVTALPSLPESLIPALKSSWSGCLTTSQACYLSWAGGVNRPNMRSAA